MRNIATNLQAKRRTIEISRIGETARARREAQREASEKDTGARSGGDITEDTHGGAQIDDSSAQVGEHKNTGAGLRADTGKNDPQHEVELGSFFLYLSLFLPQLKQKAKSHRGHQEDVKDAQRGRLVEKYKSATEKLVCDQRKIVQEIKSNTPLLGLLKSKSKKIGGASSDEDETTSGKKPKLNGNLPAGATASGAAPPVATDNAVLNPFKAVTAALAAGAVPAAAAYGAEAANEWMQSLSMFGYGMPAVFPGATAALYRPPGPPPFAVSANYRGFAPFPRGRGRGRGRGGRPGYDSYYNPKHYDNDRYDDEDGKNGYYHKSSRGR